MVELREVKITILNRLRLVTWCQPTIPEYLAVLPTNCECTSIRCVSGLTYSLRTHRPISVPTTRLRRP